MPRRAGVNRINRQPSNEVTIIVSHDVLNMYSQSVHRAARAGIRSELASVIVMPSERNRSLATHKITVTGTTVKPNVRMICMSTQSVSTSHAGCGDRNAFVERFSSVQRPETKAGAPSNTSFDPTSLSAGVSGVIHAPAPTETSFETTARIPILHPLPRWTGPTCTNCPDQLVVWIFAAV